MLFSRLREKETPTSDDPAVGVSAPVPILWGTVATAVLPGHLVLFRPFHSNHAVLRSETGTNGTRANAPRTCRDALSGGVLLLTVTAKKVVPMPAIH